jgi:hypothetical protein
MERANRLAAALDPAVLMERQGLDPDPWQAKVLRSQARRILLLCARKTGKSLVAACAALHEALYHPQALVLLLSPTLRQSQELFKKVTSFYQGPSAPMPPEQESALRMELANGSRIVSLPGKEETVRGYSGARLLVIDEAARVDDELYLAVRPMLAVSGGRLLCLSIPYGKRGFFYEEWENMGATWERVKIVATQCPRISPEFLEEARNATRALVDVNQDLRLRESHHP